jgi:hypothetical protein
MQFSRIAHAPLSSGGQLGAFEKMMQNYFLL